MAKQHAYRDLKICSKDCLCLFVCPTGASNNETGQIDFEKCIGCGACALACPAKAISMIPNKMPPQQKKDPAVIHELNMVIKQKVEAVRHFKSIMEKATTEEEKHLYQAFIHANKVMVEDLFREAGYMLPQSSYTHQLLMYLKEDSSVNQKNVDSLLNQLEVNDKEVERI